MVSDTQRITEAIRSGTYSSQFLFIPHMYMADGLADYDQLIQCLIDCPNAITSFRSGVTYLPECTMVKLLKYLATNPTIQTFDLYIETIDDSMYALFANVFKFNSSLSLFYLEAKHNPSRQRTDFAFANALRFNLLHPSDTWWFLYRGERDFEDADFGRLKSVAEKMAPPSMLEFLLHIHSENSKN